MTETNEPSEVLIDDLIRYAVAVLEQYREAADVPEAETDAAAFISWYRSHDFLVDRGKLCERLGVAHAVAEAFDNSVDAPLEANPVLQNWPRVCLAWRGDPLNRLLSVQAAVTLRWEDGRVVVINGQAPDTGSPTREWNAGEVVTVVQKLCGITCGNLASIDLDDLHANAVPAGDRADAHRFAAAIMGLSAPDDPAKAGVFENLRRLTLTLLLNAWQAEDNLEGEAREIRERRRAARPEAHPNPLADSMALQVLALPDDGTRESVLKGIAARDPGLHRQVRAALARKV